MIYLIYKHLMDKVTDGVLKSVYDARLYGGDYYHFFLRNTDSNFYINLWIGKNHRCEVYAEQERIVYMNKWSRQDLPIPEYVYLDYETFIDRTDKIIIKHSKE